MGFVSSPRKQDILPANRILQTPPLAPPLEGRGAAAPSSAENIAANTGAVAFPAALLRMAEAAFIDAGAARMVRPVITHIVSGFGSAEKLRL